MKKTKTWAAWQTIKVVFLYLKDLRELFINLFAVKFELPEGNASYRIDEYLKEKR